MIGGGLALNDTGFILVQAMCPTSSLSWSVTLFLSLGAQSLWGYKREGVRRGESEVRSDSGPKGRVRWELRRAVSVRTSVVRWNHWVVVRLVHELIVLVLERAHPLL